MARRADLDGRKAANSNKIKSVSAIVIVGTFFFTAKARQLTFSIFVVATRNDDDEASTRHATKDAKSHNGGREAKNCTGTRRGCHGNYASNLVDDNGSRLDIDIA
jgi:hypothetical protein